MEYGEGQGGLSRGNSRCIDFERVWVVYVVLRIFAGVGIGGERQWCEMRLDRRVGVR